MLCSSQVFTCAAGIAKNTFIFITSLDHSSASFKHEVRIFLLAQCPRADAADPPDPGSARPRTEHAPSWPTGRPRSDGSQAPRPAAALASLRAPDQPRLRLNADRAEPGKSQPSPRGVTAPSLAPAFLPCTLPGHLLLWKAHPCIQAAVCGGDGPAFLSAPTAPHPLRASAQLWTRVPATRAGEEVPLNPWQQLFRPGTDCLCPRSTGQREHRKTPRDRECLLGSGCGLSWLVCHTRVARALPTSCGS